MALVGYGTGARFYHAPYLRAVDAFAVTGVVTSNPDRTAQARADLPGVDIHRCLDDLLTRRDSVDLVVVSTPSASHGTVAQRVLRAGLDVVVDKPLTLLPEDAAAIAALAAERGRHAFAYLNRRWDSDFSAIAAAVAAAAVGEVRTVESRFARWRPAAKDHWTERSPHDLGGGILYGLGIHLIDQALVLSGPVTRVLARVRCVRVPDVPDDAEVTLVHRAGARSSLLVSDHVRVPGPRFRVRGTAGALECHGMDPQEAALRCGVGPVDRDAWREALADGAPWIVDPAAGTRTRAVPTSATDYWERVALALTTGAAAPVPLDEAIEGINVMRTVRASWLASGWRDHPVTGS